MFFFTGEQRQRDDTMVNPTPRDGSGWTRCGKKNTGGGSPSGVFDTTKTKIENERSKSHHRAWDRPLLTAAAAVRATCWLAACWVAAAACA